MSVRELPYLASELESLGRLAHVATSGEGEGQLVQAGIEGQQLLPARDPLVLALLVASTSNLVLVLLYWAHLLYSACSHSSSPSLFPHTLLLGLFLGSSSSLAQVSLEPASLPTCVSSLILPMAYSLIYSSLLVRLVYLRSLHKGVYLPSLYQALLLFFCLLVQISLTGQLALLSRELACSLASPQQDLLSLAYVLLLLLSCLGLATLLRHTAEHYREARSLWAALLLSTAGWVAWVSTGLIFPKHFQLAKGRPLLLHKCVTLLADLGLEATVLTMLLVVLLPRDRRTTYIGKEGLHEFRGRAMKGSWARGRGHSQFATQGSSYMGG